MNEFEKIALEFIGKKEKEKIASGVKDTDELSTEQCEKLKATISNLSKEEQDILHQKMTELGESEQVQIAGGAKKGENKYTKNLDINKLNINKTELVLVAYGGPQILGFPYRHPPKDSNNSERSK